jgi:hypothetical protein
MLEDLSLTYSIWNKSFTNIKVPLVFDLNYDVPYKFRGTVKAYVSKLSEVSGINIDLNEISIHSIFTIEKILENTLHHQKEHKRL